MREGKGMQRIWKMIIGGVMLSATMVLGTVPVSVEAATAAQKEQVKQKMIDIFYSADTTSYSMLGYSLRTSEFDKIYDELITGEHERMLGSYYHDTYLKDYALGSLVTKIQLINEDKDVLNRYKRVNENADTILAGIEPEMDDLDKVIYLHDAIADLVVYNDIGDQSYTLGGALGDRNAVCKGYAKALNLLLKETGFETDYVRNPSMMHGWSYVKLDGEWYHIDVTWDDKKKGSEEWVIRKYMLRNEAEFMAAGKNSHGNEIVHTGGSPVSDSTRFSNWFMHDVVGKIAFEDGLWYYVDPVTMNIVRADAEGSGYEVVVRYTGQTLTVVDAEEDMLIYASAGQQVVKNLLLTDEEIGSENDGGTGEPEDDSIGEKTPVTKLLLMQDVNLCDYTLWCDGEYNAYGEIQERSGYFSTAECYATQGAARYTVTLGDGRFRLLVNEYGADGQLIRRTELTSGAEHEMAVNTEYVGLTMYMPAWPNMPMSDFVTKLKYNLHKVEVTPIEVSAEEETLGTENEEMGLPEEDENDIVTEPEGEIKDDVVTELGEENTEGNASVTERTPIQEVNLCDYTRWCDGEYNDYGEIQARNGYFSTGECYGVQAGESYIFTLGDGRFRLFVNEYDADGRFIRRTELISGTEHVMDGETAYVGLTMYMPAWPNMPMSDLVTKLKYNLHTVAVTRK